MSTYHSIELEFRQTIEHPKLAQALPNETPLPKQERTSRDPRFFLENRKRPHNLAPHELPWSQLILISCAEEGQEQSNNALMDLISMAPRSSRAQDTPNEEEDGFCGFD
jgi:hypothetical protein